MPLATSSINSWRFLRDEKIYSNIFISDETDLVLETGGGLKKDTPSQEELEKSTSFAQLLETTRAIASRNPSPLSGRGRA